MKPAIRLVEQIHKEVSLLDEFVYEYKFSVNSELEKHDLMYGFEEAFIDFLKQSFEMTLREYLQNSAKRN